MAPAGLVANNRALGSENRRKRPGRREPAIPVIDPRLVAVERQIVADGIEYLLAQFVDIQGSARVKLVPASELRVVVEEGAGFAGGAVWGVRQGAHSHDPYLALASYLAAGLAGVDRRLDPGEPNLGNLDEADPKVMADRGVAALSDPCPRRSGPWSRTRSSPAPWGRSRASSSG